MSLFNLSQLEAFVAVAERGSFSAAARHLGRAQSAISTQVANLELDTGLTLFERDRRKNELTQVGYELLEEARFILNRCESWGERAIAMSQDHETKLVFALSDLAEVSGVRDITQAFCEHFPDVMVEIIECRSDEVFEKVRTGEADLGLALQMGSSLENLLQLSLGMEEMAPFCHKDHPLAQLDEVTELDLARHRQVVYHGREGRSEIMPVLAPNTWICHTMPTACQYIDWGISWGICPSTLVEERVKSGDWVKLKLADSISTIEVAKTLVWRANREIGPALQFMIDNVKERL